LGLNYRLGEVGAAMGVEQMKKLPGFLEKRERNFELLADGLSEIDELTVLESGHDGDSRSSHYALVAVLDEPLQERREEIIDALKANGVGTSVYYPKPLPETRFYRETYGYEPGSHPTAATISYGSIAFPVGPHIEEGDVETIVQTVKQVLSQVTVRG
jgi:dTDP-4-amino-4,6-dideoxygalactose transaminase